MTNKKVNQFTKGEWGLGDENNQGCEVYIQNSKASLTVSLDPYDRYTSFRCIERDEMLANRRLITTAGATATKLAEMGYDAVKVIERLPEFIVMLNPDGLECDIEDLKVK